MLDAFPPPLVSVAILILGKRLKLHIRDQVFGHVEPINLEVMFNILKLYAARRDLNPCNIW